MASREEMYQRHADLYVGKLEEYVGTAGEVIDPNQRAKASLDAGQINVVIKRIQEEDVGCHRHPGYLLLELEIIFRAYIGFYLDALVVGTLAHEDLVYAERGIHLVESNSFPYSVAPEALKEMLETYAAPQI